MSRRNANAALARTAPVFAALGDETRLSIVARLCADGPLSIAQLREGSKVTRQAITKHLDVLTDAGLVRDVKKGRERICELEPHRLAAARKTLDQISADWDSALARLKAFVEE
jgi:DNA-binding transcriptional ArsR family regulator